MKMWGGRFTGKLDPAAWKLNASLGIDQRLALQDIQASMGWAGALKQAGVLSEQEWVQIQAGLREVAGEFEREEFVFQESDEDIHTAVERRLGELIGALAGKLHTGRSRNDQVVTDLRLWLLEYLPRLDKSIANLQAALVERAEADMAVIIPGYTHLQRAQPILLSHWWLSHFWPLQRDRQRLAESAFRTASMPLGSGALAGSVYPIDRVALADELGFVEPTPNSLDAVADRDFVAEFLFCAALVGVHLSKMAEAIIIFASAEFGFFEFSDAFATGSSLMPQKKNLDVMELARAKAGTLLGYLIGLLSTLKGLPSAYDKDLQEDKLPVFNAFDTLSALLPVLAGAISTLTVHAERAIACVDASMLATDLADYLVEKGVPFRGAHDLVGRSVRIAEEQGKSLDELSLADFQALHPLVDGDVLEVFNPLRSVSQHQAFGGTAPEMVKAQLRLAKSYLADADGDEPSARKFIPK